MRILFTFLIVAGFSTVYGQCDPFFGKIVINEFMTMNSNTATDPMGEYDDWIELYNPSDEPVNLEGYFLSDGHGDRTKFVFPEVVVAPGEYLIVWCDGQIDQPGLHTSFGLNGDGEKIVLSNPDTLSVDYVRFGPIPQNISMGRYPNGTGPFAKMQPTFGAENNNSEFVGLVINEFMAVNTISAYDENGEYEDWVELYNNSNQPINLEGYFLSDKVKQPERFVFPDTTIGPNEYLIIWADGDSLDPGLHTNFKLGGDGDDIILYNPDTVTIDYIRYGLQVTDISEGRYPNGTGKFGCPTPTFGFSNGGTSGVEENLNDHDLVLWPNPAASFISFDFSGIVGYANIYSIAGKLVKSHEIKQGRNKIFIGDMEPGLYIFHTPDGAKKFIKQ